MSESADAIAPRKYAPFTRSPLCTAYRVEEAASRSRPIPGTVPSIHFVTTFANGLIESP